mgnify:CR=1 FL=1
MGNDMLILTTKHPKGQDGYKTFSVRLRESMVKKIEDVSRDTGRSRNELIGLFLEYALEHYTLEEGGENEQSEQTGHTNYSLS